MRSHRRFGTAKWILPETLTLTNDDGTAYAGSELPESLDFVTARTEFYEHPTALPTVERSSIKQDLHRRDFTINTLTLLALVLAINLGYTVTMLVGPAAYLAAAVTAEKL